MTSNGRTASAEVRLRLVTPRQDSVELTATLRYCENDPYAVRFAFHVGFDDPVEWVFARELLDPGPGQTRGIGDVRVRLCAGGMLTIDLSSPSGRARFETPAAGISGFLRRTFEIVPAGREGRRIDIDTELNELLS